MMTKISVLTITSRRQCEINVKCIFPKYRFREWYLLHTSNIRHSKGNQNINICKTTFYQIVLPSRNYIVSDIANMEGPNKLCNSISNCKVWADLSEHATDTRPADVHTTAAVPHLGKSILYNVSGWSDFL